MYITLCRCIRFASRYVLCLWQGEAEACHAALVLVDRAGAVLLGVVGFAEEHALITDGLFLFAYAAWL